MLFLFTVGNNHCCLYANSSWHIYYSVERGDLMKLLSVGLTGTTHGVASQLQHDCCSFLSDGFRISVDEISKGKYTFVGCNIVEGELSFRNYERVKDSLKKFVVELVADFILNYEERRLIRRIIERSYDYFSIEEQESIFDATLKILNTNTVFIESFTAQERRDQIISRLAEYLSDHHELVVDGFIQFRLKDYRKKLNQIVDKAVDDLMMELEYKEFIRVLRYFVNVQDPQVGETHVLFQDTSSFKIFDSTGKAISNQYLDNFACQYIDEISYEDLLITALISLSPNQIVLHNPLEKNSVDLITTLQGVFGDRVAICQGCELCLERLAHTVDSD